MFFALTGTLSYQQRKPITHRQEYSMKLIIAILSFAFLTPVSTAQNVREAIQNMNQIATGKAQLERDIRELGQFGDKIELLKLMYDHKDQTRANTIKETLLLDMMREVRQSEAKADQARREIAQSSAEVRTDNRELRRDRRDSNEWRDKDDRDDRKDTKRDRRNRRDDKRDLRDDIRDYQAYIERAEDQREILEEMKLVHLRFSYFRRESANEKKVLIYRFRKYMEEDIEATRRELAEDHRERREDRRERHDDRQERRE
jgi:hypothetical protein